MKLISNCLYIVSTPIGNLDDITIRATEVLKKSDIILCEDTRHSLKLLNNLKIKKKLISYHKFNEKKQTSHIIKHINQGKILSLISDAGTPLISDPGNVLINECIKKNIKIVPIPGVSSIVTAMSVSGFDDKFLFYGFLPKKEKELNEVLSELSTYPFSQIFFIPGLKVKFYLEKFKNYFLNRKIFIGREMTKIYETFYRGNTNDFKIPFNALKGELTVVISNKKKGYINKLDDKMIIKKAKIFLKKYSLKDTVDFIFKEEKINKKKIYQICLNIKNEKNI